MGPSWALLGPFLAVLGRLGGLARHGCGDWAAFGRLGALLVASWWPLGALLGASWGPLGALLGASGGPLGVLYGRLGVLLGRLGPFWGASGAVLGRNLEPLVPFWAVLGPNRREPEKHAKTNGKSMIFASRSPLGKPLGALLGRLEALLDRLEAILERSWTVLGPSWAVLGSLGALLGSLEPLLGCLGALQAALGPQVSRPGEGNACYARALALRLPLEPPQGHPPTTNVHRSYLSWAVLELSRPLLGLK